MAFPSATAADQLSYRCQRRLRRWRQIANPSFLITIIIYCFINAIVSCSASDVSPNGNHDLHNTGPGGKCNNLISTRATQQVYLGQGIFFAIKSDDDDDKGLSITSFGFHVDVPTLNSTGSVDYEVFELREEGFYASPERDSDIPGLIAGASPYDYRIESDTEKNWNKIAEGKIVYEDLTLDSTTLSVSEKDFYQIPFGTFSSYVKPNGGIRSFFIATRTTAFIYTDIEANVKVNDEMSVVGTTSPGDYAPKLLVGEGIVSYPPLPDNGYLYQTRSFVGKVFYEKECPSSAPSLSTSPSSAPTVVFSESPSLAPSLSLIPSDAPSAIPSQQPSLLPTAQPTDYVEKLESGVKVSFAIPCTPGEPIEGSDAIEGSVRQVAEESARGLSPHISKVNATVMGMFCTPPDDPFKRHRRRLPVGSSALDFSVVVTGEYRPPQRPGERPPPLEADLGKATEDSINRDPVGFVKDIKARAGTASVFAEVEPEDLTVQAFELPEDITALASVQITPNPTKNPTPRPTLLMVYTENEDEDKSNGNLLLIFIVITGGLIVLLAAFLFFRHGQRKAAKNRARRLEREELQRERMREGRHQQADWERAKMYPQEGKIGRDGVPGMGRVKPAPQYGPPKRSAYGQAQPPPPNYYAGGPPPPQGYNYSYPMPPPPPYGQTYAGSNPQVYPYPPAPPVPPMAGASYDQQPQRVKWER